MIATKKDLRKDPSTTSLVSKEEMEALAKELSIDEIHEVDTSDQVAISQLFSNLVHWALVNMAPEETKKKCLLM
jgi:hypothetical protein